MQQRHLSKMRILAVDHGDAYIGLALSDPDGIIARPLPEYSHVSRQLDAAIVARTAEREGASTILLGAPSDSEGEPGKATRRVARFAAALKKHTSLPVKYWDEPHTTIRAIQIARWLSARRNRSSLSTHSIAAAVILQDYLDAHAPASNPPQA